MSKDFLNQIFNIFLNALTKSAYVYYVYTYRYALSVYEQHMKSIKNKLKYIYELASSEFSHVR